MLTVRELEARLAKATNKDAVVCLCVDDYTYSAFEDTIDECAKFGPDNCFLLTLVPDSDIATKCREGLHARPLRPDGYKMPPYDLANRYKQWHDEK
jgi:hypothetical protein